MSHEGHRLGKDPHKHDARTLMLARFVLPEIHVPQSYDFDKGKTPLPLVPWGNDVWGDCVIAGEANHLLRLERIEQRRTVKLTTEIVVDRYKLLTGAKTPSDNNDTGLVVLDAMRDWRANGFQVSNRNYKIVAYGELEPNDRTQLRMASYVLHGIHFGFWLPNAAQRMNKVWDWNGEVGAEWQPGSWGGHLVFSKKFNPDGHEILSWGEKIFVTNAFIERYCDEAWAVVDSLDNWRVKQTIDVPALIASLHQISKNPVG